MSNEREIKKRRLRSSSSSSRLNSFLAAMLLGRMRGVYCCLCGKETENDRNGRVHAGEQTERDARGRAMRIYRAENFGLTQESKPRRTIQVRKHAQFRYGPSLFSISAITDRLHRPSWATMLATNIAKKTLHVGRQRSVQTAHSRVQLTVLRQYKDLLVQAKYLFDENAKFTSSGFND
jgi:hypothetical protein